MRATVIVKVEIAVLVEDLMFDMTPEEVAHKAEVIAIENLKYGVVPEDADILNYEADESTIVYVHEGDV